MNFVPFLLVLLHQNLQLVESAHDDTLQNSIDTVSTLHELQQHIEIKLDNTIGLKTDLTNGLYDLSSLFVREGLEELDEKGPGNIPLEAQDKVATTIRYCANEILTNIDLATTKFTEIEEKINSVLDAIKKVKNDSELQLVEQLKQQYESTIAPVIEDFLKGLIRDAESLPLNVKTCVDEALADLRSSFSKTEL